MPLYGGIEAGGTKFVCAVGTGPDDIRAETRFPTSTPDEAITKAIDFFKSQPEPVDSIGIATFGPVDPDPESSTFGYITTTPKPNWADTNFVGTIKESIDVPIGFETDVNGAALGEQRWGAAQGLHTFVYITVGTGVGGGAMVNGKLAHGMMHPEMGHMFVPHRADDPYQGMCPFHGDCWEGLTAGGALWGRWEIDPTTLAADHPAWELEAHYLALGLVNIVTIFSPQRVIMGGGVMDQAQLFPLIRSKLGEQLNGYIKTPQIIQGLDDFVVPPGLGNRAGVLGAIALAQDALGDTP